MTEAKGSLATDNGLTRHPTKTRILDVRAGGLDFPDPRFEKLGSIIFSI